MWPVFSEPGEDGCAPSVLGRPLPSRDCKLSYTCTQPAASNAGTLSTAGLDRQGENHAAVNLSWLLRSVSCLLYSPVLDDSVALQLPLSLPVGLPCSNGRACSGAPFPPILSKALSILAADASDRRSCGDAILKVHRIHLPPVDCTIISRPHTSCDLPNQNCRASTNRDHSHGRHHPANFTAADLQRATRHQAASPTLRTPSFSSYPLHNDRQRIPAPAVWPRWTSH